MTTDRNALKAGLFILISIGMMIGVIIGIKGVGRFLEPMQHANALFKIEDDIGGLAPGDEVRIGGAKVGVVRDVEFVENAGQQNIVVSFTMPKRFPLHKDAAVAVQSTVTGVSVLNFTSLGTGEPLGAMIFSPANPARSPPCSMRGPSLPASPKIFTPSRFQN